MVAAALLLAACASPTHRAPVVDRPAPRVSAPMPAPGAPAASASATGNVESPRVLPGAENAGKPGFYSVRPGDTMIRIGLEHGQNWRDIARWNGIDNPNLIEVGQVLRVVPPGTDATTVATARPVAPAGQVETRPLDGAAVAGAATPPPTAAAASGAAASAPASPAPARDPDENVEWGWPATGGVAAGFDEARNKGLSISGKAGDPVLAAADGRVVYAGAGLRGYGNLVIVKHNNTYLTAYAHNQTLLVREDQPVRRGQRIAEMGSSDTDRVHLYFEIRRQGRPIDPARLLPAR